MVARRSGAIVCWRTTGVTPSTPTYVTVTVAVCVDGFTSVRYVSKAPFTPSAKSQRADSVGVPSDA